ncbi:aminotransferase class I/II-fold pyridoxal phosphate-dependent enzyme [Arthrobacter sp. FW305-BF8]|uniref:aminotransferase class I/II-fold pyridoxal phosphate-dependent enzyme n=1 Tax=Arthrobacter sp. FW305-BF8 TaxID=2879617 RepID=UPI001F00B1FC|nr:aminotransferase class I/II-fold pyridoxal phosphate-dependent enzyme [Arthrobacter sp. FW305-BF8]UKA52939.1 aminotransferase class I/II-fold pyridoxal phosphate-dependent enzyme [Arthrobacter sp. FW305-BF8]
MTRVPLAIPNIGAREAELVNEAISSGFVSSVGRFVSEFEDRFAQYVGAKYAVACASGTAALHIAMRLAGVQPGDLVAVSDFTFMASSNAASYQFAELLLVDAEENSWCMDVDLLRSELERRQAAGEKLPKVIEIVHILGQPADAVAVMEVARDYGITVIEDAAEALGATWTSGPLAGKHVGTVGHMGAFSFNGNKIMTTGGGGMFTTNDEELARRAKHLSTQARLPDRGYLHDEIGFNYRLTNIAAALGVAQLERLDDFVSTKREIAKRYNDAFAGTAIQTPPDLPGQHSTYWLYSIQVPADRGPGARDQLQDFLAEVGIESRSLWRPLHMQPPLTNEALVGGSVGESLFARGLSLPCSTDLTAVDQKRVIDRVHEWLQLGSE